MKYCLWIFQCFIISLLKFTLWKIKKKLYHPILTESGDFKKFKPFTKSVPFNDLTLQDWHFILQVLRDQKKFAAMAVLTTGNCGVTFEPATYIHKLADIPGFKYRWLDVGQMLKYLRENNGVCIQ